MRQPGRPLDPSAIPTHSVRERKALLRADDLAGPLHPDQTLFDFLAALPKCGAALALLEAAHALVEAAQRKRPTIALVGEPLIAAGFSPPLAQMIDRGLFSAIALEGAAAMADFELGSYGQAIEDPESPGYGSSREVGETFNQIVNEGVGRGFGLGEYLGRALLERAPRHVEASILARASTKRIPATVHPLIGAEAAHRYPSADGSRLGKGAQKDFLLLAGQMSEPNGGGLILDFWSEGMNGVLEQAMRAAWQAAAAPMGEWRVMNFSLRESAPGCVPVAGVKTTRLPGDPVLFSLFSLAVSSHPVV